MKTHIQKPALLIILCLTPSLYPAQTSCSRRPLLLLTVALTAYVAQPAHGQYIFRFPLNTNETSPVVTIGSVWTPEIATPSELYDLAQDSIEAGNFTQAEDALLQVASYSDEHPVLAGAAMRNLGIMYKRGDVLSDTPDELAFYWFEQAARNGDALGMINLGAWYIARERSLDFNDNNGFAAIMNTIAEVKEGIKWSRKGADKAKMDPALEYQEAYHQALWNAAQGSIKISEHKQARALLKESGEAGNPYSYFLLGDMCYKGTGWERPHRKLAGKYWELAIHRLKERFEKDNDSHAAYCLGVIACRNDNPEEAKTWLTKAAKYRNREAQTLLDNMDSCRSSNFSQINIPLTFGSNI